VSANQPPWIFPYVVEPGGENIADLPIRPAVAVSLVAADGEESPKVLALVDSGSERTLASPGLGRLANLGAATTREMTLEIGGRARHTRFGEVTLRLYQHALSVDEPPLVEWSAEVGFFNRWEPPWGIVLGQRGFFDHFTIVMSRFSNALAVDRREAFDERFEPILEDRGEEPRRPRFPR
jgi:hypothetical protein